MTDFLVTTLRENPELAIFLALGVGFQIGKIRIAGFEIGSVAGVLMAGILIGQLDITVAPLVKSVFFMLFIFAIGYSVGPQFVRGIASGGLSQALFAVVISCLCLLSVFIAAKIQGYESGFAAGLFAGSQTMSAAIGVATDTINDLGLGAGEADRLIAQIPVAYAVVYLWGTIGAGLILSLLGPKLLGIDLAEECRRYEAEMSGGLPADSGRSAWRQVELRVFRLKPDFAAVGKTIEETESLLAEGRVFIQGLRRDDEIVDFGPSTVLQSGDVVAVSARREAMIGYTANEELEDRQLLDVQSEKDVDVIITNKAVVDRTVIELGKEKFARGVYLSKIVRGPTSEEIPVLPLTTLQRGDVLTLTGTRKHIDRVAETLGYIDRPTEATDMVWVGLAIALGGVVGALTVPVSGIPLTLSTAGGGLIAGILLGWLRSVYRVFGRVPGGALWLMQSLGLNAFIAVVGISSGPTFVSGLKEAGLGLFLWGAFATSIPMLLAPLIGKYIFRFDPAINLGCCGGARASVAAPAMVGDIAKSKVPMLGYAVPCAVSTTLLTIGGMVIVLLTH
jgi:putative transport protein